MTRGSAFGAAALAAASVLAALAIALATAPASSGSTPQSHTVTVPDTPNQTVTVQWDGVIPINDPTNLATSDCDGRTDVDTHDITLNVPAGTYDKVDMTATFTITWTPASPDETTSDEVLTVVDKDVLPSNDPQGTEGRPQREVGSSDGGTTTETVVGNNLPQAHYQAQACGFANATPQPYHGTLKIETKPHEPPLASAPSGGMAFSAAVPADPQRDEGEPLVQVDRDGRIYTCGPTGFSTGADYAQVSEDGGNQFHLLGEPPRGQQAPGGGGDCSVTTAPVRNDQGYFNYAYSGLGPLTSFATAASSDGGHTLAATPASTGTIPGVDRQWQTFLDRDTVLLDYNQQEPRQVVVQKSTDGGLTYGPAVAATPVDPSFPGPMRTIRGSGGPIAYFPFSRDADIYLGVSSDGGAHWTNCHVVTAPGDPTLFVTADHDSAGNVYVAYGENAKFHTYVTSLAASRLQDCNDPVDPSIGTADKFSTKDPGWSKPVQVDRDAIGTTVFPWITAGGAPGRVAVAFYGSETDGDPNVGDFQGTWNVYVNQSLNALADDATFSQTKATTHPVHYDSICLNGLGCDVSGGDRSLADFFAIAYDGEDGALHVVYDTAYKRPGDAEGSLATPMMVNQVGGPSNGGGDVSIPHPPALRDTSDDPTGDAIADYSSLGAPPHPRNEPAADFKFVKIAPAADGGFKLTMTLADLSDAALAKAVSDSSSQRLLWIFRWFNGYRSAAAVARWSPTGGFSFGYNDFVVGSAQCGSSGDKCLQYPGDQAIEGSADQRAGTLTLTVPASKLKALSGGEGPKQRPKEVPAHPGDRLYDGTAFSLADASAAGSRDQTFLYALDNAPAMDFLVPATGTGGSGGTTPGGGSGGTNPTGGTTPHTQPIACAAAAGLARVAVRGRGHRARIGFARRAGAGPVRVDVVQQSSGARVLAGRLVARFNRRTRSFTWNGRANRPGRQVTDGFLVVRLRARTPHGVEVRRVALRRVGGRLRTRPAFQRRATCSALRSFSLGRPVFGGATGIRLTISYRLAQAARVTIRITHAGRTVKRITRRGSAARIRVRPRGLPAGDYRIRISAAGVRSVLTARRL